MAQTHESWGCARFRTREAQSYPPALCEALAQAFVDFLERTVFAPGSGVHRGTFIEDTYGKQTQMHAWLNSAAFVEKRPPPTGCLLLTDAEGAPMMRHLDGKSYLDPEQREARGLPPYPTDWTAALADR